jgi:hypothetical protein
MAHWVQTKALEPALVVGLETGRPSPRTPRAVLLELVVALSVPDLIQNN